jgi:hypothetical protein
VSVQLIVPPDTVQLGPLDFIKSGRARRRLGTHAALHGGECEPQRQPPNPLSNRRGHQSSSFTTVEVDVETNAASAVIGYMWRLPRRYRVGVLATLEEDLILLLVLLFIHVSVHVASWKEDSGTGKASWTRCAKAL